MKLAEALIKRKNLKVEIEELRIRAGQYAVVQEGNVKVGETSNVLGKIQSKIKELRELIVAINKTNQESLIHDPNKEVMTIMEAIACRDMLKLEKLVIDSIADIAMGTTDRYTRNEIRTIPTIDVEKYRRESDSLAKQYRLLDAVIQAQNWTVELSI